MITRLLSQTIETTTKSILLLGPRQVGKSTLISALNPELTINLSFQDTFLEFSSNPSALTEALNTHPVKSVFIDEIQRLPSLLNTIQALIDKNRNLKFYLTGSSARKLKRGRANLLPGRVFDYQLGPFVSKEFDYRMQTQKVLQFGCLPEAYLATNPTVAKKLLRSYAGNYLKEEIQAEALSRNLESFSRFLTQIVYTSGQFIDYSKISKVAKISRHACARYFEVLEDSLIGFRLYPFEPCLKSADLIKHPKFYMFDIGVYNGMVGNFTPSLDRVGALAEQLVFNQVMYSSLAHDYDFKASTFRTRGGLEIDFIFEIDHQVVAIEVKAAERADSSDVDKLLQFKNYFAKKSTPLLFHLGREKQKIKGIWCLPWQEGLKEIGL